MNNPNESSYQQPNISAEDQPPKLTPEKIPSGYTQMESGLLIKSSTVGNIAARTMEQVDQFHEIKEILRGQKKEALSGYQKFAEDLGEKEISEEDYDRTFAFNLKKWEADGSLKYLQNWLKQNPGHKVYMSVSPNKVIARTNLCDAEKRFIVTNTQSLSEAILSAEFLYQYSEKELSGPPVQDNDGNDLPIRLTVWTDTYNLDAALMSKQFQALKEIQKTVGSASDQTIPQTLGYWHRLLESEDFGGVGAFKTSNDLEISEGIQLFADPKSGNDMTLGSSSSPKCVPRAVICGGDVQIGFTSIEDEQNDDDDEYYAGLRFVIS